MDTAELQNSIIELENSRLLNAPKPCSPQGAGGYDFCGDLHVLAIVFSFFCTASM